MPNTQHTKKTIAVVYGGKSAEHEVSIITAHIPIIQSLEAAGGYDVWSIYISKDGSWYCSQKFNDLNYFKGPVLEEKLPKEKKIDLRFENGLEVVWPGLRSRTLKIDIVFPAMHGTYGEDGSLMGVLRMANVPFVGCDLAASAAAMDKVMTKQIVASDGVPVVPYVWFTKSQWEKNADRLRTEIGKLHYPLFVKPVHLGSSIGISKCKTPQELENGIEVALHYDDKILVEEGVQNLVEVTLPIMGNDELRLAEIERPLNKTEFFDFKDKYLSGGTKGSSGKSGGVNTEYSEIPAKIDQEFTNTVKEYGKRVYTALGCTGIARVDFLIDGGTRKVYMNEVNTLPGSLYHHNWRKAGVSNVELVTSLVRYAEERFAETKKLTHTFESGILEKVGGPKAQF